MVLAGQWSPSQRKDQVADGGGLEAHLMLRRRPRQRLPGHMGKIAMNRRPAWQGFFHAPERTRTSTDHTVHKALNLGHPA